MKQSIFFISILALVAAGCSKDNDSPVVNNCIITTIKGPSIEYALSYDANGRLQSTTYNGYSVAQFSYSGNTITALQTSNGNFFSKTTATINADGLATSVKIEMDQAGTNWRQATYQYTGTQVTTSTLTKSSGTASNRTYTWTNGNLVKETIYTNSVMTQVIDYEYYTDKPYQPGDLMHWSQATGGFETVRSKNLLKKYTSKYLPDNSTETISYAYSFDGEGKISGMTETTGSASHAYTYQYQCK